MKLSFPLAAITALLLAGCTGNKQTSATGTSGPPKDGLKQLGIEDLVIGKPTRYNPTVKPVAGGDAVWVVYTGRLKDGTVFDSNDPKVSSKPNPRPMTITAGAPGVIEGWQKGFFGMLPGGVRKLSVPWKMGYGELGQGQEGQGGIPPYTDLYFEVKVLDYVKPGEEFTYGMFDVAKGSGPEVKASSTVVFHTIVRECDGKVIEDTHKKSPIITKMGTKGILVSVEDAMLGMRKGGIREISLPPPIGFPPMEDLGTAPGALYYVQIHVIDVK